MNPRKKGANQPPWTPAQLKAVGHVIYDPLARLAKGEDDTVGGRIAEVSGLGNRNARDQRNYAALFSAAPTMATLLADAIATIAAQEDPDDDAWLEQARACLSGAGVEV